MPPKRPQPPRPTGTGTSAEPPRKRAKPTSSVGSVGSAVALEALADATATAPGQAAEAKLAQRASPPVATDEAPAAMPEGSLAVEVHFFSDDKHGPHIYKYWSGDVTYGHVLNDFCEEAQLTLGDLTFKAVDGTPITADTPLIPGAHARRGCGCGCRSCRGSLRGCRAAGTWSARRRGPPARTPSSRRRAAR